MATDLKNSLKKKKRKKILRKIIRLSCLFLPSVIVLAALSRAIPMNTTRLNLGKSNIGEKAVALTFDDGPSNYTEELLDGLAVYDVKVTFFVEGKNAEKNPDIVKRAHEEGHLIGNHTYSHIDFFKSSLTEIREDIDKGAAVIQEITGEKPLFLRAPYGHVTFLQLKQLDCFFVRWSASTYDWFREEEEYIYNRIMNEAKDGEIILMHDTREVTVKAVLKAIPELQEQGFEFVTVDELLTRNGNKLAQGIPYRKCENGDSPIAY
ncbi:MAG: polysaccharide deacetylase family protein [Acutalibacteraceae bacterium]